MKHALAAAVLTYIACALLLMDAPHAFACTAAAGLLAGRS
jgi:hypothetical protein